MTSLAQFVTVTLGKPCTTRGDEIEIDGVLLDEAETAAILADFDAWGDPVDLAAYAATKRWEKEVGGCLWNGWPVHTNDRSQGKIVAEVAAIDRGDRTDPDDWKFADGEFRMISNADFIALALAAREHVRACFAIEAAVLTAIDAGAITTTSEIDAAFAA